MASYVIYDIEFTAWQGSRERNWSEPWEHREIIQIAAASVEISDEGCFAHSYFDTYIKPLKNPTLSEYVVKLTGITQDLIDREGVNFNTALSQFAEFCGNRLEGGTLSYGPDDGVFEENARIHGESLPLSLTSHTNLRPIFYTVDEFDFHVCSGDLHKLVGIPLRGDHHNAVHDVQSLVVTLDFLLKEKLIRSGQLVGS